MNAAMILIITLLRDAQRKLWHVLVGAIASSLFVPVSLSGFATESPDPLAQEASFSNPIEIQSDPVIEALSKVVKLVGAGGYLGLEPFQTGIAVAPDGWVLTCWSHVLLEPAVTVTLADGRRFFGEVVAVELELALALIKIDSELPAWFDLSDLVTDPSPGQWVYALHNAFGIAVGQEPVSIQRGIISGRGSLTGRRDIAGKVVEWQVLFLDFVTSAPGTAGGAVVDLEGRLVGLIGKPVLHQRTRVWSHYAIPAATVASWVQATLARYGSADRNSPPFTASESTRPASQQRAATQLTPEQLGIYLVPELVPQIPAFVDWVVPGSWADRATLLADDLIVTVNGQIVRTCREFRNYLHTLARGQSVKLGIQRGDEFIELECKLPD